MSDEGGRSGSILTTKVEDDTQYDEAGDRDDFDGTVVRKSRIQSERDTRMITRVTNAKINSASP